MKLFDVCCPDCGERWEEFCSEVGALTTCLKCGSERAVSVISPVRFRLDGTDEGFPTAYDRWAKVHEEAARKAKPED